MTLRMGLAIRDSLTRNSSTEDHDELAKMLGEGLRAEGLVSLDPKPYALRSMPDSALAFPNINFVAAGTVPASPPWPNIPTPNSRPSQRGKAAGDEGAEEEDSGRGLFSSF